MIHEDLIYYFMFNAPGLGHDKKIKIFSGYRHMIKRFISTHMGEDCDEFIQSCEADELPTKFGSVDADWLRFYYFKNNENDNIYIIPTTSHIIDEVTTIICSELSAVCEFGDVITQTDIPIFLALQDNLYELPFVSVLDNQKIDGENPILPARDIYVHTIGKDCDPSSLDDALIWDSLREEINGTEITAKEVMPITLSSYVSSFTKLLFDPREWRE